MKGTGPIPGRAQAAGLVEYRVVLCRSHGTEREVEAILARLCEKDAVDLQAIAAHRRRPGKARIDELEALWADVVRTIDVRRAARRQRVGIVTSGTRSPILKKNIALCRMAVRYSEQGTAVEVGKLDGLQKRIPATVVRFPFYDPDKTRPRS